MFCHRYRSLGNWKIASRQAESEEDLLEHRTDGANTFETIYIGCEKFPQADISPVAVDTGGIM